MVQPIVLDERLAHIAEATRQLDTRIPWLADSMDNELKHAFGDKNNSEFVISPQGKVLIARNWSDPKQLRLDLAELVGESESTTSLADLDRHPQKTLSQSKAEKGVVPRVKRPANAAILTTTPIAKAGSDEADPFYVKLRAEAPRSLIDGGKGQLYLGFHLDPIHRVHWNNLAAPLKYEISGPDGVEITEAIGSARQVDEAKADIDPREFLIDIDFGDADPKEPLVVRVDYFACDDDDRFCKAVSQEYEISWTVDPDAGRVAGGSSRGEGMRRRPGGGEGDTRPRRSPDPDQLMSRMDANKDGSISKDEAQGQMVQRFNQMDKNGDEVISKEEIEKHFERMRQGRRPPAR